MILEDKRAVAALLRDLAAQVESGHMEVVDMDVTPKLTYTTSPAYSLAHFAPCDKRRIVLEMSNMTLLPLPRTTDAMQLLQKKGLL